MAIIRNERTRRAAEPREEEPPEEEIDYGWHPNEEEFVSPLTAEQWAELLGDPSFADTDAARAIRCLLEYGGPATFQQLSIRYRGTMGRYRRWLSEAAQAAGERFGVSAPQQDQFGMDEWWPLLYCVRNTGKPGAGIQEMLLRPEVVDAYDIIAEEERQAKRAENARNLKRIEQLERARQEEREREAARLAKEREEAALREQELAVAAQEEGSETEVEAEKASASEVGATTATQEAASDANKSDVAEIASVASEEKVGPQVTSAEQVPGEHEADVLDAEPVASEFVSLPALQAFLETARREARQKDTAGESSLPAFDVAAPIDYALRYAERLRFAIARMQEGAPRLSAAQVARALGDESVEELQGILNGQQVPSFAYLERVARRLFVNVERLEARDGLEDALPVFCTLDEVPASQGVAQVLAEDAPCGITYVVCKKRDHQTLAALRFGELRCALLTRVPFSMQDDLSVVEEFDAYAREAGVERVTRQVDEKTWDALVAGQLWAGALR